MAKGKVDKREAKAGTTKRIKVVTGMELAFKAGLKCIGDVCFTDDGRIEVHIDRDGCPPEVLKKLVETTVKGARTEFVLESRGGKKD